MHTNYYFLKKLVPVLKERIIGLKLMEAFSQDKDELVIGFAAARGVKRNYKEYFIKAEVSPTFAGLFFSKEFRRAKKNSISLIEEVYEQVVEDVCMLENDRSFYIQLSCNYILLFKLHGNRSNILLLQNEEVIFIFNQKLAIDNSITIPSLEKHLIQDFTHFEFVNGDVRKVFPTFGKLVMEYLDNELSNKTLEQKWQVIGQLLYHFDSSNYYIVKFNSAIHLTLFPIGEVLETYTDPIEAANAYYVRFSRMSSIEREKMDSLRLLVKRKKQTTAYLKANYERLEGLDNGTKKEEIGHILMANLHQIPERISEIILEDFYRQKPIKIKLKDTISAQKNAEYYYRKAKNEKIEVDKLIENIEVKENDLLKIEEHIGVIEKATNLKELRSYLKSHQLTDASTDEDSSTSLFKKFVANGFEIWVGKNAKNNDLLTQRFAFKEDLWLHARDTTGSHVLIKYKAGQKFPTNVIESAASIAAYFSKRKTEKLVPVIVTTKKFVRKIKGMPEGKVKVEKEDVILVEPKLLN